MIKTNLRQFTAGACRYFVALLAVMMMVGSALAQTEAGQITGKVVDPAGAVVAGATVSVKSVETGREVTATSDNQGLYTVTSLQPGLYDVTTQGSNFKPNTQRVQVTVGSRVSLETQLSLTEVSGGTINVIASEGVEVNTQSQELSNVVSGTQIRQLPTLTRNPYDLVGLSSNVSSDDPGQAVAGVGTTGRGAGFSINGQRAASTNVLLDGVDNTNTYYAAVGQNIPLDAVGEFRVITSNFSAEYGRASGGVINVSTRGGSNSFHGSAFEFNRISRLASNGFNNNANGVQRGVFTRNQFGYTIGGPIKENKLFFFNSTEWTRVRSTGPVLSVVPTPQLIAASNVNTRNYFAPFNMTALPTGTTYTVAQATEDLIPAAQRAGNAFANLPANMPAFQLVQFNTPVNLGGGAPQDTYSMASRVDYNLSNKTTIYGRWARESIKNPIGSSGFSPYAGFSTPYTQLRNNFIVSMSHTFSSTFVSDTKLAYNRLVEDSPYGDQPIGPGLFMFPGATGTIGGQPIAFPGYWPYNAAASPVGFAGAGNTGQIYQDFSLTKGRHQFRFGGVIYYIQDNRFFGAYQNAVQSLSATANNYAQALDNFVNGSTQQFQAAIYPQGKFPGQSVTLPVGPPDFTRSNRYNEWAAYINDSWRFSPRLVLNLGMRYEYYGVQHNKNPDLDSNFYFGAGSTIQERIRNGSVQIAKDSPVGGLWKPDKNNFAPRVGFAWDMFGDGRTSLRGGYGLAYERNFGNVTFNVIQNPPNYLVLSLQKGVDIATLPITSNNFGPLSGTTPPTKTIPVGSLRHVREDIVNAYAHFWSVALQREVFGAGSVLSVEYSGSAGRSLYSINPYNQPGAGAFYLGSANPTARLNTQYSGINARGNDGFSNYNALIVNFDANNFRNHGVQFTAHYTYGVNKDNLSTTFSESAFVGNLGLTNPFQPDLDYGYADADVRHRFVGSVIWDVPLAKQASGWEKGVLGGWQVTGIFNARTGTPFTIFDATNALGSIPRMVANGPIAVNVNADPTQANFFNYINLASQTPGAFGNPVCGGCSDFGPYPANMTKRNQFRGPGIWNFDAGVYKNFKIGENKSLQFRGEMFNAFNHANLYILPGTNDVANGVIGASKGLTPNGNLERRNVQLAVKFIF
ncbi:MAG TPA: TonB-dependent receptor [Pyrinomonadaceae bacterium]|nr:TonB-dependent receptor [Pyrinomonadaceae bacterium]